MAESISEGTLATLHKEVGEEIEADEELASIETDKVDVPINAPQTGQIMELFVSEGDLVKVGQDVAILETEPGATESSSKPDETQTSQSESTPAEESIQPTATPNQNTGPLFRKQSTNEPATKQNDSLKPGERVVSLETKSRLA